MKKRKNSRFILGLDIGANSIGWALMGTKNNKPNHIERTSARIFEAGVDGQMEQGREESLNKKRRDARGQRRTIFRRAGRKKDLWSLLQGAGLAAEGMPNEALPALDKKLSDSWMKKLGLKSKDKEQERARFLHVVPYFLRAHALDEKLTPHELGRALYHLAQRRGFLSNRKATPKDKEKKKEEEGIKAKMADLQRKIDASATRTLGEYFSKLNPEEERIRSRYTTRNMYEKEFEEIWRAQSSHHPRVLTEDFRKKVHHAIFYQRPLKIRKEFIGDCEFEKDRKRAPWALLVAQRFRLIQNVNNLEFADFSTGEVRRFTPQDAPEERAALIEALETQGNLTFSKVRKNLKLPGPSKGRLNLEEGGNKKMMGNHTAARLVKIFGEERWKGFSHKEREQIVEDVHSIQSDEALENRGKKKWKLDDEKAKEFGSLELEDGYCRLSRQAIARLLPLMERGKHYMAAVKEVYGERPAPRPEDALPRVVEVFPDLRNPVVVRVLTELRKVVNNIIGKYGKPYRIRVELARERKKSKRERQGIWKKQRQNEKAREEAAKEILKEMPGSQPKGRDIEKVLLAEECDWHCPYTGKSISMSSLLGPHPQFDVEHIIPLSRCLDSSFYNKTLGHVEENRNVKGNKTPFETYGSNPKKWNEILQRVKNFKGDKKMTAAKLDIFQLRGEALDKRLDDFENRKLTDTAYASRQAMEYLGLLYGTKNGVVDGRRVVQAGRGQVTGYLRNVWELNKILNDGGQKSRDDHRHHAVDAICIALSDAGTVKMLSDAAKRAQSERRRQFGKVDPPWPGFQDEARSSIGEIVISHRVGRKASGPLHEGTNYSPQIQGKDKNLRHVRKPIQNLSKREAEKIVDPKVRQLVLDKLGGKEPKTVFSNSENRPCLTARDGRKIPIQKARIEKNISTFPVGRGSRERHVATDSNHHIEVIETLDKRGKPRWEGLLVSLKEARDRQRAGKPIINRDHGEDKRFVFSLAGGETIEIDKGNGERALYIIRTISRAKQGRKEYPGIDFVHINDARKKKVILVAKDWKTGLIEPLRKLNCQKVLVTPLGEVRRAND